MQNCWHKFFLLHTCTVLIIDGQKTDGSASSNKKEYIFLKSDTQNKISLQWPWQKGCLWEARIYRNVSSLIILSSSISDSHAQSAKGKQKIGWHPTEKCSKQTFRFSVNVTYLTSSVAPIVVVFFHWLLGDPSTLRYCERRPPEI
jgi:hypothetical protein